MLFSITYTSNLVCTLSLLFSKIYLCIVYYIEYRLIWCTSCTKYILSIPHCQLDLVAYSTNYFPASLPCYFLVYRYLKLSNFVNWFSAITRPLPFDLLIFFCGIFLLFLLCAHFRLKLAKLSRPHTYTHIIEAFYSVLFCSI